MDERGVIFSLTLHPPGRCLCQNQYFLFDSMNSVGYTVCIQITSAFVSTFEREKCERPPFSALTKVK